MTGWSHGEAWSPRGDAVAFVGAHGPELVTLDGRARRLLPVSPGDGYGVGWTSVRRTDRYREPELLHPLVEVSGNELRSKVPIGEVSADGDRVAYWLCHHVLGAWRPGDAKQVALGNATVETCNRWQSPQALRSGIYDLTLAGDRVAYLTTGGGNTLLWELIATSLGNGDEGDAIVSGAATTGDERLPPVRDLTGAGSTIVFGAWTLLAGQRRTPEAIWRVDGMVPHEIAQGGEDLQPLAVDGGRIVACRGHESLDLLDADGNLLARWSVAPRGAALAGDDLVVLVEGALREYSVSTGELLHEWPLPDVPSAGRCGAPFLPGTRLTLDAMARGRVLYTLGGVIHLLRLADGADVTIAGATSADLTDAGLFDAYAGDAPWPGRLRFVPFAELPL